ncbi:MAG: HepT-like ribonuclease domain-containing protein [Candidatus Omnitrophota bacterium]
MQVEIKKYLYDIEQAIAEISEYTKNENFASFSSNTMIQSAVERKFEIIGEALSKIKRSTKEY